MENKQKIFFGVLGVVVLALILIAVFVKEEEKGPGEYDKFAQCLTDSGATFYGAFWCPHCNDQKKLFGSSKNLLPYVECSTPDGNGQSQICLDKAVASYPTWEFIDGTRQSGVMSLEDLSLKTSCPILEEENLTPTENPPLEDGETIIETEVLE